MLGADNSCILARGEILSGMVLRIILEAGAAQGITANSQMAVYDSNLLETPGTPNQCLGYLTVTSVKPFTSILGPSDTSPQFKPSASSFQVYCLLDCLASQKITLYCENGSGLKNIFPPKQEKS